MIDLNLPVNLADILKIIMEPMIETKTYGIIEITPTLAIVLGIIIEATRTIKKQMTMNNQPCFISYFLVDDKN